MCVRGVDERPPNHPLQVASLSLSLVTHIPLQVGAKAHCLGGCLKTPSEALSRWRASARAWRAAPACVRRRSARGARAADALAQGTAALGQL
eukprot:COSAG03_NODE_894_length_5464_cov_8.128984_3_plen_92_part_00